MPSKAEILAALDTSYAYLATAMLGEDVRGAMKNDNRAMYDAIGLLIDSTDSIVAYRGTLYKKDDHVDDLDTVTINGIYHLHGQTEGYENPLNCPTNLIGTLVVDGRLDDAHHAYVIQTIVFYDGSMYVRYKQAEAWTAWKTVVFKENFNSDGIMRFQRVLTRATEEEASTENNDLDLAKDPGVYYLSGTITGTCFKPLNTPPEMGDRLGILLTAPRLDKNYMLQLVTDYDGKTFIRFYKPTGWTNWKSVVYSEEQVMIWRRTLRRTTSSEDPSEDNDLNYATDAGVYFLTGTIHGNIQPYNTPAGMGDKLGVLIVSARNDQAYCVQTIVDYDGACYYRLKKASNWTDWKTVATTDIVPPLVDSLSVKILQRVGCIGDSYMRGYLKQYSYDTAVDAPAYSWVSHMQTLTGHPWTNFAVSGSSTKSWVNGNAKLADVQAEGNKCQAYIIGLGINDSGSGANAVPVGTVADIDLSDDPTVTESYYYYYARLIKEVNDVNPTAPIICFTIPNSYTPQGGTERYEPYNVAVRNVVTYCRQEGGLPVYICDLKQDYFNSHYFKNPLVLNDQMQGHQSPVGYEFFAECLKKCISDTINYNLPVFQGIYKVPYDPVS